MCESTKYYISFLYIKNVSPMVPEKKMTEPMYVNCGMLMGQESAVRGCPLYVKGKKAWVQHEVAVCRLLYVNHRTSILWLGSECQGIVYCVHLATCLLVGCWMPLEKNVKSGMGQISPSNVMGRSFVHLREEVIWWRKLIGLQGSCRQWNVEVCV